jgi:hypothetical protein
VSGSVDCLGCHHMPTGQLHWRTGCPHDILCMRKIAAEDVFAALVEHIGSTTGSVPSRQALVGCQ